MAKAHQRRRLYAGALVLLIAVLAAVGIDACGSGGGAEPSAAKTKAKAKPKLPQLPGGGRMIFPEHRVVGFYGHPNDDELGELGIGTPDSAGRRLLKQIKPYERKRRPVLPAFELLASIAANAPGDRGDYSTRTDDKTIRRYLRAARRIDAILILDIQPGYAEFLPEVKRLRKWLKQPDVSLALDPEWKVPRGSVPGQVIGSTSAADVNEVSQWLDDLAQANRLPQKLLLIHQFTDDMITNREQLRPRKSVAVSINVDGFGGREVKSDKYRSFARQVPWAHKGFKLFYKEDTGLMTPRQVLRLRPDPSIVVYE